MEHYIKLVPIEEPANGCNKMFVALNQNSRIFVALKHNGLTPNVSMSHTNQAFILHPKSLVNI